MRHRQERSNSKLFVIVTIPLISLCATFILLYFFAPSHRELPVTPPEQVPRIVHDATSIAIISRPVQLKIDIINIVTTIQAVGLTPNGDMDIDENPEEVAWYKLGPKPGEEGSAVIAGHYGWKNGVASVFNDLNKLVKGDEILVVGEDGQARKFIVSRTATYAPDQDATDVFRSDDGKAHLNLVTCQGSWNNTLSTYSERLVVFTDLVK